MDHFNTKLSYMRSKDFDCTRFLPFPLVLKIEARQIMTNIMCRDIWPVELYNIALQTTKNRSDFHDPHY